MTDIKPRNESTTVHRPTAFCAAGVLTAVMFILGFSLEAQAWIAALIAAAVLGLSFVLPKFALKRMLMLVFAGMLAGSMAIDVAEQYVYRRVMHYADHSYRYEVSGLMIEDAALFETDTRILLMVDSIDGQAVRGFKTYAYLKGLQEIDVGKRVTLELRFEKPRRDADGFDALQYYRAKGVYLMGKGAQDVTITEESAPPLWLRPALWSKTLKNRLHTLTNERHAAVLQSLMLGETSEIDPTYEKDLRRCGLSHIMAVSGMNVVFLSNFCILLLRRRWGSVVAVPVIVLFTCMVGAEASVVRAAMMQLIFLGAYAVRRENDSLNALIGVLALMLVYNPWYLYDAGLWLSFASTLGLILVGFRVRNALEKPFADLPKPLRRVIALFTGALGATISTMIFVLPLQLYYFRSFSLIAPLANMLLLWAVEGAFFLGMTGVLLSFLWLPLGKLCMGLAWPLVEYQLYLVPKLARLPFSLIPTDAFTLIGVGIVYGFLLLYVISRPKKAGKVTAAAAAICLCAVVICADIWQLGTVTVTALDTRGGQAVAVYDGRNCMVINCGGADSAQDVVTCLESMGIGRIDVLVLTDEKKSSLGGAAQLSRQFPVECLLYPRSAAADAAGISAGQYMSVESGTVLESALYTLRLLPTDAEGFDADRMTAELTTRTLRFLITGSVDSAVLEGLPGAFDVIVASDYYVSHELPGHILREGSLWLMPSWNGLSAGADVMARESGAVAVDLREQGNVVFTIR